MSEPAAVHIPADMVERIVSSWVHDLVRDHLDHAEVAIQLPPFAVNPTELRRLRWQLEDPR